ncbi:DUF2612 domain-containing protein [Methylobacterium terricola]|uniref:DUF2612 domain-containing protein n=1 Tax=Methylobacterium terricola TaxID=2583531 RepID=A0A5C4LMW9_9HYPH|nr:DUF2612 domain-containing protein [Methylobacterium terricola]TNC14930.1 DUF2612 domain-containing protein [Methylobacterium terricola]
MIDACPSTGDLVAVELGRIATQYREAEHLRGYMTAALSQVEEIARVTCAIPDYFDIRTAVGEQLTFLGKRMGFPRCHCVCDSRPVVGFACETQTTPYAIVGFCEDSTWLGCDGYAEICLSDDEVYRAHLYARRYQMLGLFDLQSLGAAVRAVWGNAAWIPQAGAGRVVLAPGRDLTTAETQRLSVTLRALPIAPGVGIAMHYGPAPIAGFGAGWAGFCDSVPDQIVVGFDCADEPSQRPIGGFCTDAVWTACAPSVVPAGYWLCPVPIDPYACP